MNRLVPSALRLTILFFCTYGLLYYAYKNQDLALVGSDFFTYYNMYLSPLDLTAAEPPAVYRQLSAIAIHLVYRTGIYYPCAISMQVPGYDQHMFFAALLTNYLFLILAAWVAGAIVQQELATQAFVPATMAGLICLLSFYSQVECLSWLLFGLTFRAYLRRQVILIAIILFLTIFQRELNLLLFATFSAFSFFIRRNDRKLDTFVFSWSLTCFLIYFLFRKFAFLPEIDDHIDPARWLVNLRDFHLTREFIFQGFLSQNLLLVYIVFAGMLAWRDNKWASWLPVIVGSVLVLAIVAVAANEQNGLGCYSSVLAPILAAYITVSCVRLEAWGLI